MIEHAATNWRPTASLQTLKLRAGMLRAARDYFTATYALEVETPALSTAAVTDPHLASIAAIACGQPRYLHTSPEYAMKRLLAAHRCDIYQIARVYRDGESGRHHNPEFTLIEWYRLNFDHHQLMDEVERLIDTLLPTRLAKPAERLSYRDALQLHAGIDAFDDSNQALIETLQRASIQVPNGLNENRDALLDLLMAAHVGPKLGQHRLTFIYDYPTSQAALARIRGPVASRFEVYLHGIELANGFHELGDSTQQRQRFEQDLATRRQNKLNLPPIDENFLAALEHGLPDCAGVALGFDRLVMCATGASHIDEVLTFPFERA